MAKKHKTHNHNLSGYYTVGNPTSVSQHSFKSRQLMSPSKITTSFPSNQMQRTVLPLYMLLYAPCRVQCMNSVFVSSPDVCSFSSSQFSFLKFGSSNQAQFAFIITRPSNVQFTPWLDISQLRLFEIQPLVWLMISRRLLLVCKTP